MSGFSKLGHKLIKFFGEDSPLDLLSGENFQSKDYLNADFVSELLCYRLYDEERRLYENKNSFGFILSIPPVNGASPEIQNELSTLIKEIAEEGCTVQCMLWADHRIDPFVDRWANPRERKGGIYKKLADRKREFLCTEAQKSAVPPRFFRVFLSLTLPKPFEKDLEAYLDKLSKKREKVQQKIGQLFGNYGGIDLLMHPPELLDVISGFINYDLDPKQSSRTWNKNDWLSQQLTIPGGALEVRPDGLIFQGKESAYFKSYEAVDYPNEWGLSGMDQLIGDFFNRAYNIPCPFFIQYGLYFPKQSKTELRLKARSKMVDHQSKFPALVKLVPHLTREAEENLYVSRQLNEGELFVETRLNCGIWSPKDKFIDAEATLKALFRKYGFRLEENHYMHLHEFITALPMSWGESPPGIQDLKRTRRLRTTITSEVGAFFPVVGEWMGNSSQGVSLIGRRGQLATWDPFSTQGNYNTVVVGPSNSGKSVFMQDVIMNALGADWRVFILDLGRSFQNLCHLVGGEHLTFSADSNLDLNPFHLISSHEDIESVISIIGTMAMPSQKIDKDCFNIISESVQKLWASHGNKATVDDLINLIASTTYESHRMRGAAESLKESLKRFSSTSSYASYFYGQTQVNFENNLLVIETEELKSMPDLQAVIIQMFVLTISKRVFQGSREKRSLICIEEAWNQLNSPQMEGFIEGVARRIRKHNGALLVVTQGLKDFDHSPGAKAAFQNSNWLLMLGRDTDSINIIKKQELMPMDDYLERSLNSLRKVDGEYSEVLLYNKTEAFWALEQLRLDPFSVMLYSTKAEEFQAVQELQKLGLKVEDAISWMVTHRANFKKLNTQGYSIRDAVTKIFQQLRLRESSDGMSFSF